MLPLFKRIKVRNTCLHKIAKISSWYASTNINKAIIIGGGPCGSITGLALQQKGIKCDVYERISKDANRDVGAAITLHGATACLKYLGFEKEWLSKMNPFAKVQYMSNSGKILAYIPPNDVLNLDPNITPGFIIRSDLYEMITNWCIDNDDIQYFYDKEFLYYTEDNNEITAHFSDGTSSSGNILIGADGVNSNVRKQILGDQDNKNCKIYSGFSFYYLVGNLSDIDSVYLRQYGSGNEVTFEVNDEEECMMFWQPLPVSNKYVLALFYKSESTTDTDWGIDKTVDEIIEQTLKYKWHRNYQYLIEKSNRRNHLSLYVVKLQNVGKHSWHKNRALIIGDASHAITPFAGQGGNQAIYDGIQLAHLFGNDNGKMLCDYSNDEIDKIFEELYNIRNPITTAKVDLSLKMGYMEVGSNKWHIQKIRNFLFKYVFTNNIFGLRDQLLKGIFKPDINFELFPQKR